MELKKIDEKYYISIYQLRELGFDYPPKGTKGLFFEWLTDGYTRWYKFHEKKEGWDGIFISIWLSDVGKMNIPESSFLIEFTPELFKYTINRKNSHEKRKTNKKRN